MAAGSGRRTCGGGMTPVRTFCSTFSHTAGLLAGSDTSIVSSASSAVFKRALWHVAQYVVTNRRSGDAAAAFAAGPDCAWALTRTGPDPV